MSPADGTLCTGCGVELRPNARFCGSCGRSLAEETAPDRSDARRATRVVGTIYLGVLAVVIAGGELFPVEGTGMEAVGAELLLCLGFVVVGLVAGVQLGGDALRSSVAGPATGGDILLGAALGAGVLTVNVAWLTGLNVFLGEGSWSLDVAVPDGLLVLLLGTAVLPAVFEEWVSRGILWTALERVTEERATIFLSAALFAMFHGLNGAQIFELPSRFILGLALGWLRARSGSLVPAMAAHFVNNALACLLVP